MSFRYKFALAVFLFSTLFLGCFTYAYYTHNRSLLVEEAHDYSKRVAHHIAEDLNKILIQKAHTAISLAVTPMVRQTLTKSNAEFGRYTEKERGDRIKSLNGQWQATDDLNDPFIRSHMSNPAAKYLRQLQAAGKDEYGEIFLTNQYGAMVATTGKLSTLAHAHKYWWKAGNHNGEGRVFFDDRGFDLSVGGYVLGIVVPVMEGSDVVGILKFNLNILNILKKEIYDSFEGGWSLQVARSGGVVILEKEHPPLSTRLSENLLQFVNQPGRTLEIYEDGVNKIVGQAEIPITRGSEKYGFGGSYESIDHIMGNNGEGWHILMSKDMSQVLSSLDTSLGFIWKIGTVFILLMVICAVFLANWLLGPLLKLTKAVTQLGHEKMAILPLAQRNDEIGLLASTLMQTAQDLKQTMVHKERLEESEERYRLLFTENTTGFALHEIICDASNFPVDYRFLEINPAFEKLTGLKRDTVVGQTVREVMPGIESSWIERYGNVAQTGTPVQFEEYSHELEKYYETKAYSPQKGQFAVLFTDISGRRRAEEKLAESERKLKSIIENTPIGMHLYELVGEDFIFIGANPAADTILSLQHSTLIGKHIIEAFPEIEEADVISRYHETLRTGITWHSEHVGYEDSQTAGTYEVLAFRISSHRLAIMFLDITERIRAEEELRQTKLAAEAANQTKSEFLANMSHELRTPLNGVLGMLQVIQGSSLDEEQQECIEIAIDSGKNLTRLIGDILDLSRAESGKLDLHEEEFDPENIMLSLQILFMGEASRKSLSVNYHTDPALPSAVIGDEGRIRQVVINLLGNAVKFTEHGEVNVRAYSGGKEAGTSRFELCFEVSDTGIGIPGDKLEMIYEPFTQVDGSYTRKFGGSGLGLSIVKRLIKLMDAELHVDSEVGVGTTFRVSIPVKAVKEESAVRAKPSAVIPSMEAMKPVSKLQILLAEDDPSNQLVVKRMLEKQGHTLTCVATGKEAFEAVKFERYDLVLMDVQMPEMDGTEATIEIRKDERFKDLPVIALTAHAMTGDKERFLNAGMNAYLAKPLDMEELKKVLAWVMASKESHMNL